MNSWMLVFEVSGSVSDISDRGRFSDVILVLYQLCLWPSINRGLNSVCYFFCVHRTYRHSCDLKTKDLGLESPVSLKVLFLVSSHSLSVDI